MTSYNHMNGAEMKNCVILVVFLLTLEVGYHCSEGRSLKTRNAALLDEFHHRRHGIIPNSRRRGDSHLRQKIPTRKGEKVNSLERNELNIERANLPNTFNKNNTRLVSDKQSGNSDAHHRRRRWEYEDTYEWENGGKDYDIPGEEKKETAFEKFAKNWQKHALKVIFVFSIACTICICLIQCCQKCCLKLWDTMCWHCKDWRDYCLNRDPTFRKARKFADDYGIELDYDQYKKIKTNYEEGFRRQGQMEYSNLSGR